MLNKNNKLRHLIMWATLAAIYLLTVLSVLGAFYGAKKAKLLFNSIPLGVYWFIFATLLIVGLIKFSRLRRHPGLLMIHLGCLMILAGGLWGSVAGYQLRKRFLGIEKIPSGYMVIFEGQSEKHVVGENLTQTLGELPFSIKLNDFRIEYYKPDKNVLSQLYIETPKGKRLQLMAKEGEEIFLGDGYGSLKIVKIFRNFKILFKDNEKIVTDEDGAGENPAVEVEIKTTDGKTIKRYAFEYFTDFHGNNNELKLRYISPEPSAIRDYISDVVIIEDGEKSINTEIEVNHPLHYKGYHFYQHSYDPKAQQYTILSVVSDSGLYTVYAGYWLLCLGTVWRFWLRDIVVFMKSKNLEIKVLM